MNIEYSYSLQNIQLIHQLITWTLIFYTENFPSTIIMQNISTANGTNNIYY